MSPIVSSVIALVALGLAIAAIVLATIANRRWASRSARTGSAGSAPGPQAPLPGAAPGPDRPRPDEAAHADPPSAADSTPDLVGRDAAASDGERAAPPGSGPPEPSSSAPDSAALESLSAALAVLRGEVDDLIAQVDDLGSGSSSVRSDVDQLRSQVDEVAAAAADPTVDPTALRNVALVRYDAFADVGGRLSYSAALLDDTGSGLVLTTLSGKADVRTYVRTVSGGSADGSLTAEEQQAIDAAVGSGQ